jgi:hypothetical protein
MMQGTSHRFVRSLLALLVAGPLAAAVVLAQASTPAVAQDAPTGLEQFSNITLPPDLGQASVQVFVAESGHTLRGYFLDYWRANGGASTYGYPISEPFASEDGLYSQAFQNGIFQFRYEHIWTDLPSVTLMPIGQLAMDQRIDTFRNDGRRGGGGGDRRSSTWKPLDANGTTAQRAVSEGGVWSETTGHTITGPIYQWYLLHEGIYYLGQPLSQPHSERGRTVQYFEGALVTYDEATGEVALAPLGEEMAPRLGIDTSPVDASGLPLYNDLMFYNFANPNPMGDVSISGKKRIEISLSQQRLWAYQGDTLITTTLISTGLPPNETERGFFHVRYKLPKQDMAGTVAPDGSVIAVGEDAAEGASGNQEAYMVKDVPNVMYFNHEAEALHGAYWHNNFGNRMSHGCVNLPLDMANFLYEWAPLGTIVWVYD